MIYIMRWGIGHTENRKPRTVLGVQAVDEAGKGDGLPHVVQAAEPGHQALDAHPEAAVGTLP